MSTITDNFRRMFKGPNNFFSDLTEFLPRHTSIISPLKWGLAAFIMVVIVGVYLNKRHIFNLTKNPTIEERIQKQSRMTLIVVVAIFVSFLVSEGRYAKLDYAQNKMWYTWKYKWFPGLLR